MNKKFLKQTLFIFVFSLVITPSAYAANTTIDISPQSGSFGELFKVNVFIDGHGDIFNAAEATVKPTDNLIVKDLTLGDCNFSYLNTPSVENPSFSGVILSGSSKKCTVYSMMLVPNAKGIGSITLSNGSVRRYGDAVNVLSSMAKVSYTLTGVSSKSAPTEAQVPYNNLYTVAINVIAKQNEPLQNGNILLTSTTSKKPLQTKTDTNGKAQFSNIEPGIYYVTVRKENKDVAKTIINVKGSNHLFTFGINLENQTNNTLLGKTTINIGGFSLMQVIAILLSGILLGTVVALLVIKLSKRKA